MFLKKSSMREVIFDKFCNTWEKYRYGTLFGHQIFKLSGMWCFNTG